MKAAEARWHLRPPPPSKFDGLIGRRFRVEESPPLLWTKRRCPMGVAGSRFAHMERTLRVRAVVIGVLEELPFICPVVVAIGSLIMIGMTLYKDWPQ